ncbi:MAG: hypothetical protein ACI4VW_05265 [Acutalibacteraceae bacterium]
MKRVFAVVLIILILSGCSNFKSKEIFDNNDIANNRKAISEYYKFIFVVIPDEYIVFNENQSTDEKYVFDIHFNPVKVYPDIYNYIENVDVIDETLYVTKTKDVYVVYNEFDENIFAYVEDRTEDASAS